MPAKLLNFPEPRKKTEPAGEPIELPSISIAFGNQVYTLALSATITESHALGGAQPARPARAISELGAPVAEKD
jgi:hypothetical protein